MQKCDELAPSCQNCVKHGARCSYNAIPSPQIGRELTMRVQTDWYPKMDSRLFNYFVTEVVNSMMLSPSWASTSPKIIGIAIEVRLYYELGVPSSADSVEGAVRHAFYPCSSRMPLSIPSEITSAAMCERKFPFNASMFRAEAVT